MSTFIKVPWAIQDTDRYLNDRAFARYVREQLLAERAKSRYQRPYIPAAVVAAVKARSGGRCVYCGRGGVPLEMDHRVPYSKGGSSDESNLVAACKPCNVRKFNHDPDLWPMVV